MKWWELLRAEDHFDDIRYDIAVLTAMAKSAEDENTRKNICYVLAGLKVSAVGINEMLEELKEEPQGQRKAGDKHAKHKANDRTGD